MNYFEEFTNTRIKKSDSLAAGISSKVLQIRKESIQKSLKEFEGTGHRQEYVGTIDEVMYFDDAKAESVNATWFTFESTVKPIVWIANEPKTPVDYSDLLPMAKQNVKVLVCIGGKGKKMRKAFAEIIKEIYDAASLEEAVEMASILAQEDDIVLFSPACRPNADVSFSEQGELFKKYVKNIENEHCQ